MIEEEIMDEVPEELSEEPIKEESSPITINNYLNVDLTKYAIVPTVVNGIPLMYEFMLKEDAMVKVDEILNKEM